MNECVNILCKQKNVLNLVMTLGSLFMCGAINMVGLGGSLICSMIGQPNKNYILVNVTK